MKRKILSLLLALSMVLTLLPGTILAAGETTVEDFFRDIQDVAEISNDSTYPFTVDSTTDADPWLRSGEISTTYVSTTLTLTMKQAATVHFDYKISCANSCGMEVKRGNETICNRYDYKGEKSGTIDVAADAGEKITISYYRGYVYSSDESADCLWLRNFTCTMPKQVILHANNGTEETVAQGIFETGTLQPNPFVYDHHVFKGWAASADGEVVYQDQAPITIAEDTHLYAVWGQLYDLQFSVMPEQAEFGLYLDQEHVQKVEPNGAAVHFYLLEEGQYYWQASLFGYAPQSGSVSLGEGTEPVEVALQPYAEQTVTFSYGELIEGTPIENGTLTVNCGEQIMQADETGLVYMLPVGYDYTYTFKSSNYARQTGTIALAEETQAGTQHITIPLAVKTAWGGAEDVLEPSKDAQGIWQIGSGAELAWLAREVNAGRAKDCEAVLTKDIDLGDEVWTPIGKNGYGCEFSGTLDGQGHVICGLHADDKEDMQGLFGYINGGTVRNLTVKGTVAGKGTSGTGGIVGKLSSTWKKTGTVENCISDVTVSGGNNVGGVAGLMSGSYASEVKNCVNRGSVTGANSVGGLIGCMYGDGRLHDSYNRGSVEATVSKAGGLVGYMNDRDALVENCYTTGSILNPRMDSAPAIGMKSPGQVSNLYYLDTLGTDSNAQARTEQEMKSAAFPGELGESFSRDMKELVNDGYPILNFQDTTPKYDVTLSVAPAEAEVILKDAEQAVVNGKHVTAEGRGVWTYSLPAGTYSWEASAFGKVSQEGTLTVADAPVEERIDLEAAPVVQTRFTVTYTDGNPGGAVPTIRVLCGQREMEAAEDGSFALPYGEYTYTVKARGYAKVGQTVQISADAGDTMVIPVTMTPSAQWDGEEREQPEGSGTAEAPYQIENGAQLAWLADFVNKSADNAQKSYAVLNGDIDLGDNLWTPIGKGYSYAYGSSFDGQGYTVSGLKVEGAEYAGLFGYAKKAVIQNTVVAGTVSGTAYTGGLVGQIGAEVTVKNCGNTCTVLGAGNWTGGIAGRLYGSNSLVTGCYNSGAITAEGTGSSCYVGGIAGKDDEGLTIQDCYNTGAVTGSNAGGISGNGSSFAERINCYNTGAVTGTKTGAIWPGSYGNTTNCYYLAGGTEDQHEGAAAVSEEELRQKTDALNAGTEPAVWKNISGMNNGYPVLAWQKEEGEPTEPDKPLGKAENVGWKTDETTGQLTSTAVWSGVENAQQYTLVLWELQETETPAENMQLHAVTTVTDVTGTQYDFTEAIHSHGSGSYYFTVTPIAAADSGYASGAVPANGEEANRLIQEYAAEMACYCYVTKLDTPTGLRWRGTNATWNQVKYAYGYLVTLYRLDEQSQPVYVTGGTIKAEQKELNLELYFEDNTRYVFSVTALSQEYMTSGAADKNSAESKLSHDESNGGEKEGIYTTGTSPEPETPDRKGWVGISTPEQWIALANTEDTLVDSHNPEITHQDVEWSKKYYLTADLDFSNLSAADAAKTKSIGNANHRFQGILDGNGHKITGLTLSNLDAGLFGYIGSSGQVYDLKIEGANVLFSDNAAVLAYGNYGRIHHCAVVNSNITADTGAVLGGMVSRNYGTIEDSYVEGGSLTSNSTTATGHSGFVGANEDGGRIERCWSSMDVHTMSEYAGGFVGLSYGAEIRDCFSLGDVTARSYSGGFAGRSVYSGNCYENCYAAGTVTVTQGNAHGFIGGSKPDSAFQPDLSQEILNCYYNAASQEDSYAQGKTLEQMRQSSFLNELNRDQVWVRDDGKNDGLPYLAGVKAPEKIGTSEITVTIAMAVYDKQQYTFRQQEEPVTVTVTSTGNTRVVDIMDAAVEQGLLTYSYDVTPEFGRFIHTINGYSVEKPDGWMFTINDKLSNLGASLATVTDQDKLLWYEGTTENRFQPPMWSDLSGEVLEWENIATVEELLTLAKSTEEATLAKNYRLTADLDLQGVEFPGIGTQAHPFTGVFDGQNHTVSNASITGTQNVGFFGVTKGATIKNLKLQNVTVTGTQRVGGLAGWCRAELSTVDLGDNIAGLIGNCSVTGTVTGSRQVGGLVGLNDSIYDKETLFSISCSVDKCKADVTVTGKEKESNKLGGLVGDNRGFITKSIATGEVQAASSYMVGGLAGDSSGSIYDCHADGAVTGYGSVGGFAGSSRGTIKNSYSLGAVQGAERIGSFCGSLHAADFVIGAGMVTVTGSSASGYAGGLAGYLDGTLAGLPNQITVKDAYGNCVQKDKEPLGTVGNRSAFPGESEQEALKKMGLTTMEQVSKQLYEMFGIKLQVPNELDAEAEKYADYVIAKEPGAVTVLKPGASADPSVTVTFEVSSEAFTGGKELTLVQKNQTAASVHTQAILILRDDWDHELRKSIDVLQPASQEKVEDLLDRIAASYTDSNEDWKIMDMSVYASIPGKTLTTTPEAKQEALDRNIANAEKEKATLSDRARTEIVLRSMGIDSTQLYAAEKKEPINHGALLSGMDMTSGGYYAAPWVLLAELQGSFTLTEEQVNTLIGLLQENMGSNGMFGYEWDGVSYESPDMAGIALAALASRYDTREDAKQIVDTILKNLPEHMDQSGSFGNANSDAMVILGLLAVGQNPYKMKAASGASVVDGLLSYVNTETDRFQYAGQDNDMATEQAFRTLAALKKWNGSGAYNVYDFGAIDVVPGWATGAQQPDVDEIPFTDIEGHWAEEAIGYVYRHKLMLGTSETVFSPEVSTSRGMFVTVLYRLSGSPETTDSQSFEDVAPNRYYTDAVQWAAENGIMIGYENNTFGPARPITREQMAVVLYRYTVYQDYDSSETTDLSQYKDADRISSWAAEAMSWACAEQLIQGVEPERLSPRGNSTRAQVAMILMRYMETIVK